ncbi:MAG TPA: tyrosinase family protein [Solirubrobacterales bacterium]|nr:tyrosinase family protein [Solirubrobacterales bacterium]
MTVASLSAARAPVRLRHRRSARRLSKGQLADLRRAVALAQKIEDDRGYQYWAGIHGLPLPMYCKHRSPFFLPWHRAYLYFFEKALQDRVPGVTLPWWDWTQNHSEDLPPPYARARVGGARNPLASSPIRKVGRRDPREKRTWRRFGPKSWLPEPGEVKAVLGNREFFTFQNQLENIHNGIHGYVGGTMGDPNTSAYDPIFWAHHCMIDRLWYLWQLEHPGVQLPAPYLDAALPPFPMTVRQTLDITALGYDYAAGTAAVPGTRRG